MTDLAGALGLDEHGEGLRERHARIGNVELVELDRLDAQAPQAALERVAQMLGASVGRGGAGS
jgi:hypothetical protein